VNACEVKAHLIGLLAKPWCRLFLAAIPIGLNLVVSSSSSSSRNEYYLGGIIALLL